MSVPTKRSNEITSADDALLSNIMASARKHDERISNEYAGRENEIDELENEIIKEYSNSHNLQMGAVPDPIRIQEVFSASVSMLGRVTEIYNGSIKNLANFRTIRQTLMDGILPLMQGGSADAREAKARSCMQTINYMIGIEEGLVSICEATQKNIKTAQETASRQLKAIEIDLQYFNGAEALANIVMMSKKNRVALEKDEDLNA